MTSKEHMELARRIHDQLMGGKTEGHKCSAVIIEGQQYSAPQRLVHRIFHSDGYAVDVIAECFCEAEEANQVDEMNIDGWFYFVEETDLDGWEYAEIEQVSKWVGVSTEIKV